MGDDTDERGPFEPANGIKARWRYAYDLVTSKQPGDEIAFSELAELLDMEFNPRNRDQRNILLAAMDVARDKLEEEHLPTVRTVDRFGWIVLDAQQAFQQARKRAEKAARAITVTIRSLNSAPREQLPQDLRASRDYLASNLLRASALAGRRSKNVRDLERESQERKQIKGD